MTHPARRRVGGIADRLKSGLPAARLPVTSCHQTQSSRRGTESSARGSQHGACLLGWVAGGPTKPHAVAADEDSIRGGRQAEGVGTRWRHRGRSGWQPATPALPVARVAAASYVWPSPLSVRRLRPMSR